MLANRHLHLLAAIGVMLAGIPTLQAQQSRMAATPSLGDAMPLVKSADGVHLQFPVLLNAHTILQPASTLRLVYNDPNAGLHLHSGGDAHSSWSGGGSLHHNSADMLGKTGNAGMDNTFPTTDGPASAKAVSSAAGAEVWKDAQAFRDALNSSAEIGTMVVYAAPGKAKPASAEIDLPDGMLLGNPDGRIVVLSLTSDSEAGQAGLQPRDELRTLNGQAVPKTLEEFTSFYRELTEQARKAGAPYTMQAARPGQTTLIQIKVGAPPSIPSMF